MTLDELSQTVDAGLKAFEIHWSHHGLLDHQLRILAYCCSGIDWRQSILEQSRYKSV